MIIVEGLGANEDKEGKPSLQSETLDKMLESQG